MLNPADDQFAAALAAELPPGVLSPAEGAYLEEPRRKAFMPSALLARPHTTEEVATIVRACAAAGVAVVPRGGGTGLVQGQVMATGPRPVLLSLERMTRLRGIWPEEGLMVVEAGMTLIDVQAAAEAEGRLFPLSLSSEGSARIGGNLATNAGGNAVLRYGNARELCLGVEAVMPDGSIYHGLKRLRKDNTGYDIKDLLIGSEGSLGIITAATLRLFPRPAGVGTVMMAVASPAAALSLLALAQQRTMGLVSSFELFHRQSLEFVAEKIPELRQPFAVPPEWSVLMEIGLPDGIDPETMLAEIYEAGDEAGLVEDAMIASSLGQRAEFWALREALPEANRKVGAVCSHDISLPLTEVADFIAATGPAITALGAYRVNCFGHLGDGNLHYNVYPPKGEKAADHYGRAEEITRIVHDGVAARGGSFSAEHGIGRMKVHELNHYGDPAKLAAMRAIKAALDPRGTMNPGAVVG